jgi:iron complex transport system substrate-binding protein
MNPCVDAILMEVADPAKIASISHYSQDPRATSISIELANKFEANNGSAEEVIAAKPDLVIAGPHVALPTLAALKRLGIPVLSIGVPNSVADSEAQIEKVAAHVGGSAQGTALIGRIDASLLRMRSSSNAETHEERTSLIWQGGGLVPGKGTLADDLLTRGGFRNMSAAYGLKMWDILPLEPLLSNPPQVLFTANQPGKLDRVLSHPALRRVSAKIKVVDFPPALLNCGGPTIIKFAERLTVAHEMMR